MQRKNIPYTVARGSTQLYKKKFFGSGGRPEHYSGVRGRYSSTPGRPSEKVDMRVHGTKEVMVILSRREHTSGGSR